MRKTDSIAFAFLICVLQGFSFTMSRGNTKAVANWLLDLLKCFMRDYLEHFRKPIYIIYFIYYLIDFIINVVFPDTQIPNFT